MARKPKISREERADQRDRAAVLVHQGRMTRREIARALGIAPRTLNRWQNRPEIIGLTAALLRLDLDARQAQQGRALATELHKTTQ